MTTCFLQKCNIFFIFYNYHLNLCMFVLLVFIAGYLSVCYILFLQLFDHLSAFLFLFLRWDHVYIFQWTYIFHFCFEAFNSISFKAFSLFLSRVYEPWFMIFYLLIHPGHGTKNKRSNCTMQNDWSCKVLQSWKNQQPVKMILSPTPEAPT